MNENITLAQTLKNVISESTRGKQGGLKILRVSSAEEIGRKITNRAKNRGSRWPKFREIAVFTRKFKCSIWK